MKKNKKNMYTYFNEIDNDKNGFLDRKELRAALIATNAIPSEITIQNIISFFDYTNDGRISVKEFSDALEPILNNTTFNRQSSRLNTPRVMEIKKKSGEFVRKNYSHLNDLFTMMQERNGLITRENFKKILSESKIPLISSDMDVILENIAEYEEDLVKWKYWLDEMKAYYDKDDMTESQFITSNDKSTLKRSQTHVELFRRLNKTIKESKISVNDAFRIFDKNDDGEISIQEFRDAIHGMKLGLTEDEITDIIKHIGHNGCVSKKEFNKALNL